VKPSRAVAFAGGKPVKARVENGLVTFALRARGGTPADWAVTAPGR
jgi:hypothetical protein